MADRWKQPYNTHRAVLRLQDLEVLPGDAEAGAGLGDVAVRLDDEPVQRLWAIDGEMGPEPEPAPVEEVIAKAADTVLSDKVDKQKGDEVLAPTASEDDQVAGEKLA